jgi:hypothetical protein
MSRAVKSQYKHVQGIQSDITKDKIHWRITMLGVGKDSFDTERLAAIAVDKLLISKGKEPINILKRKT